ncbi:MAG TPA: transporter [Terriglobales bacterium]|nr:transporter [Terriglobales bacterium]HXY52853.1 transporter [Terriglobales bacterium]
MRFSSTLASFILMGVGSLHFLMAQDLAPRAYVITPVHSNAVTLTWAFYDGGVNFSGSIPVTATGTYNVPILTYYHSLSFFGRSANITASLPYGIGNFEAAALGKQRSAYRSGLLDLGVRFSVNLRGGPSISAEQFPKWKQKTILGASLRVITPTGQYGPTQVINWGINRWAFKPELGYSGRWGHWVLDGYGGAWFYTENSAEFHLPQPAPQTEEPIGSFEGHLSRDFGRGTWVSLDGNFWWGGVTTLNGIRNPETRQTSSRLGGTAAFRVSRHQSIKVSYSDGTYIRFGGNWQNVAVAWQYSWVGRPF